MYFPKISRRVNYKRARHGGYYSGYHEYFEEIAEDCQRRCVYCDVILEEIGGEGMHLDHFRPQKSFPELNNSPLNLVLACAKCNQLKSDWFPEQNEIDTGQACGFVDHFEVDRLEYFNVDELGRVVGLRPPANYMIELLCLNRDSRRAIRRVRAVKRLAFDVMAQIEAELLNFSRDLEQVTPEKLNVLAGALGDIRKMLHEM